MKKTLITGLLTLPMLISSPVWADKVTDQINEALKAYEEKDYKAAIDELKYASVALQKLSQAKNQKLLPKPLDGWTAQKVDNSDNQMAMSILGGGSSMKASYKRGKEQVDIEIMANSPMIAMMGMMINNPALAASKKGTESYRYKRIKGIKKIDDKQTEITLLIAGQIMLKVTGKKLKDAAVLEQYLDAMDISKLKAELL